jgi:hypothetical protein
MRLITIVTAATLALSAVAVAQNSDGNKGAAGWTGGHPENNATSSPGHPKDPMTGQSIAVHDDAEAKTQPLMATGEDLKGPPQRFAPSKTPE